MITIINQRRNEMGKEKKEKAPASREPTAKELRIQISALKGEVTSNRKTLKKVVDELNYRIEHPGDPRRV